MTAIVGIAFGGDVILGADSCAFHATHRFAAKTQKLHGLTLTDEKRRRKRRMIVGYTTSYRFGDILRMHINGVEMSPQKTVEEFLIKGFVPALRGALDAGGFTKNDGGREEGGEALIGIDGRLFVLQEDFSVIEPVNGEMACGMGREFSLGALHATAGDSPQARVAAALRAAAHWSPGVQEPFFTMDLKKGE